MKPLFSIVALGLLFHASELRAQDHAFATANSAGESAGMGVSDSGPLSATVHYNSQTTDFPGSNYTVIADASVNADQVHKEIDLKAKIAGDSTGGSAGQPSSGTVKVTWLDHITVSNPGVVIPADGFVGFNCSIDGTLSGISFVNFDAIMSSNDETDSRNLQENTPGSYNVPLDAVGVHLSKAQTFGMDLKLELFASVGFPQGAADFSNTAKLLTLVVQDANGNPIPGGDRLVFTGDSGFVYAVQNGVQTVPEPVTALLLVFGAGMIALRCRKTA